MAKDKIHEAVKNALIKDGWTITHDPFVLKYGDDRVYADLAAEKHIAAQRYDEKIVVEVKSFGGLSAIQDFKESLGQYVIYLTLLKKLEPNYKLYLAISDKTYYQTFQTGIVQYVAEQNNVSLIVTNIKQEEVTTWINR